MVRPSFIKSLKTDYEFTLYDKIEDWIWSNPICCITRKTCRFISRLIRWIPALWKQEEWDFGYTYDLLELKIKDIKKAIEKDTWHTPDCTREELEQINSVLEHLDKFRNWTKYIEIPEPPSDFKRFTPTSDGCSKINFTQEESDAFEKARQFETEHYNAFWDELKEKSGNWWT